MTTYSVHVYCNCQHLLVDRGRQHHGPQDIDCRRMDRQSCWCRRMKLSDTVTKSLTAERTPNSLSVCLSAIVFSDVCTELIRGNRQEDNMTMMADTLCALLCSFKMKLIDLFTVQCISDINFVKLRDSLQWYNMTTCWPTYSIAYS